MKLLLLSANTTRSPYPVYPLGMDYIAGAIGPGHETAILDMNVIGELDRLEVAVRDFAPGAVGVSVRNIDNVDATALKSFLEGYKRLIAALRRCTEARIILGGCGFSIFPGELMSLLDADFGIVGEGERLGALLDALDQGRSTEGLPGVICRGGSVPFPEPWPGAPKRRIRRKGDPYRYYLRRGGMLNIQTKRGCPFGCVYCTYPLIEGRRLRLSPPDEVAGEARELQELGARYLFITDSVFNADVAHSLEVAKAFRRAGVAVPWGAFFAPTRPPAGYYRELTEAGLRHVEFGTESFSDVQLKAYGKPFRAAELLAAHESAREAGAHIAHYLLLGGPGENGQTLEETLDRMESLEKAVFFMFCGIRIYPHTGLHALALREGQIAPGQDLLPPVFYRSRGIGTEEIMTRIGERGGGRMNWVFGDGGEQGERVVARLHAHGHTGPLWELLLR